MINVIVGLDLLRRPPHGSPPQTFDDYICALDDALSLTKRGCISVAITEHALPVLTAAEAVPPLKPGEMRHLHSGDVARLFYGVLQRAQALEEASGILEVLADGVIVTPDHADHAMHKLLREHYERCLSIAALSDELKMTLADPVVILGFGPRTSAVRLVGEVLQMDLLKGELPNALPILLDAEIRCASCPKHVCEISDGESLARAGKIKDAIDITIAAERINRGEEPSAVWPFADETYDLHKSFVDDVHELILSADRAFSSRLLRACAETVLFKNMGAVHALRTAAGGGSQQRLRHHDGAAAWRRDIDKEYHLHYWQIGGIVELAAVGPHNDFKIPE